MMTGATIGRGWGTTVRRAAAAALLAGLLAAPSPAAADPVILRMATVAPERSGWAREISAFSREVDRRTEGRVKLKWYWGAVAGTELEVRQRIDRGQLDGTASGGMMCGEVMPSMRALRVTGTFQNRDEASYVMNQLSPTLRDEALHAGYDLLLFAGLGPGVLFTRRPVESMKQLRATKLWRWGSDQVAIATEKRMGMQSVPLALTEAARAFDDGVVDGFYAIPAAALVFQWSVQASYLIDLPGDYLTGCMLVTRRSIDRVDPADLAILREAGARAAVRIEDLGRRQDRSLLGGGFNRQGLKKIPVSAQFRAEFFAAARRARDELPEDLVTHALMDRVLQLLADYRAEHTR